MPYEIAQEMQGVIPTRSALAIYYALRKLNIKLGYTDKELTRYNEPIDQREPLSKIDPKRLSACIHEEIDITEIHQKASAHKIESLKREKTVLEKMVARAEEVFGVDKEKLRPPQSPKQ